MERTINIENFIQILYFGSRREWISRRFVDPKGVEHSSYMDKVAGFERLFENNKPKVYRFDKTDVVFDLKLVTNDLNRVTERYLLLA